MREITGDLWECDGWKVIPTNLEGVAGRGTAKQMADLYPEVARTYKKYLREIIKVDKRKNDPELWNDCLGYFESPPLFLLPVKRYWRDAADMNMINAGIDNLTVAVRRRKILGSVYLPLLGCGFGELPEEKILAFLHSILTDQFVLVRRAAEVKERYPESFKASVRQDKSQ